MYAVSFGAVLAGSCFSLFSNNANCVLGNKSCYFRDPVDIYIIQSKMEKKVLSTAITDDQRLNIYNLSLFRFDVSEIGDILTLFINYRIAVYFSYILQI